VIVLYEPILYSAFGVFVGAVMFQKKATLVAKDIRLYLYDSW